MLPSSRTLRAHPVAPTPDAIVASGVGATGWARNVRLLGSIALRARGQRGRGRLPVRTTRTGVGARRLPLRDSHVSSFSLGCQEVSRCSATPPIVGQAGRGGASGLLPGASHTRNTDRDSRSGIQVGTAWPEPWHPGARAQGRTGRPQARTPVSYTHL